MKTTLIQTTLFQTWKQARKNICGPATMGLVFGLALGLSSAQAQIIIIPTPPAAATGAGNIDPPAGAVNGSGNPTATTNTQPSWDQNLPTANGGSDGCNSTRFKCVLPAGFDSIATAVLDKETGLVWQRKPLLTSDTWDSGFRYCLDLSLGNKKGWRLPNLHELASLIDPSQIAPNQLALPSGHPFIDVQLTHDGGLQIAPYWTTTKIDRPNSGDDFIGVVKPAAGTATMVAGDIDALRWCVRGGSAVSVR